MERQYRKRERQDQKAGGDEGGAGLLGGGAVCPMIQRDGAWRCWLWLGSITAHWLGRNRLGRPAVRVRRGLSQSTMRLVPAAMSEAICWKIATEVGGIGVGVVVAGGGDVVHRCPGLLEGGFVFAGVVLAVGAARLVAVQDRVDQDALCL